MMSYRAALTYSRPEKFRSPRSSGFAARGHSASLLAAQTLPANRYADVLYTPQCGHVGHVESHDRPRRGEASPQRGNSICVYSRGIHRRGNMPNRVVIDR